VLRSLNIIKNIVQYAGGGGEFWPGIGGGVIFSNCSNVVLNNISINKNLVDGGWGGGIVLDNSNSSLFNIIITENEVSWGVGGGIYSTISTTYFSNVTIKNNNIIGNSTYPNGGGIYFADSLNNPVFDPINRCNIYNNYSYSAIGNDLYSESDSIISIVVDTFTVLNPDSTHAYPLNKFTFDILHDTSGISHVNEKTGILLQEFTLYQNYPNPFNPRTTIEFSIPKSEFVTLKIYNLLGQEVSTLISDKLIPGEYKYTWDASHLASGMYFYKLETESFSITKKMILLR